MSLMITFGFVSPDTGDTYIGVRLARHLKHKGTTAASGSIERGPGWGSTEMISDGCADAKSKILIRCVGQDLLPTAQAWGLWGRVDGT
jgi:hypothetical protein